MDDANLLCKQIKHAFEQSQYKWELRRIKPICLSPDKILIEGRVNTFFLHQVALSLATKAIQGQIILHMDIQVSNRE